MHEHETSGISDDGARIGYVASLRLPDEEYVGFRQCAVNLEKKASTPSGQVPFNVLGAFVPIMEGGTDVLYMRNRCGVPRITVRAALKVGTSQQTSCEMWRVP